MDSIKLLVTFLLIILLYYFSSSSLDLSFPSAASSCSASGSICHTDESPLLATTHSRRLRDPKGNIWLEIKETKKPGQSEEELEGYQEKKRSKKTWMYFRVFCTDATVCLKFCINKVVNKRSGKIRSEMDKSRLEKVHRFEEFVDRRLKPDLVHVIVERFAKEYKRYSNFQQWDLSDLTYMMKKDHV